jgi:hypothetical protein
MIQSLPHMRLWVQTPALKEKNRKKRRRKSTLPSKNMFSTLKLPELISELNNDKRNQMYFCSQQSQKRLSYLGINLTKEMHVIYIKNITERNSGQNKCRNILHSWIKASVVY